MDYVEKGRYVVPVKSGVEVFTVVNKRHAYNTCYEVRRSFNCLNDAKRDMRELADKKSQYLNSDIRCIDKDGNEISRIVVYKIIYTDKNNTRRVIKYTGFSDEQISDHISESLSRVGYTRIKRYKISDKMNVSRISREREHRKKHELNKCV